MFCCVYKWFLLVYFQSVQYIISLYLCSIMLFVKCSCAGGVRSITFGGSGVASFVGYIQRDLPCDRKLLYVDNQVGETLQRDDRDWRWRDRDRTAVADASGRPKATRRRERETREGTCPTSITDGAANDSDDELAGENQ